MMDIIAHRGYWLEEIEKNSYKAFERALKNGFGVETDLRDLNGYLVISHDIPNIGAMKCSQLSQLYQKYPVSAPIALNIKSDGLHILVKEFIEKTQFKNTFVFDMAVPDMRGYLKNKTPIFTRKSEYEMHPAFLDLCNGIWLDAFESDWYGTEIIENLVKKNKKIVIVSPELHGRQHLALWDLIRNSGFHRNALLSICTDFPMMAKEYFCGKN